MALGVPEIRERAKRLRRAVAFERYEVRAGLKGRAEFSALYGAHSLVTAPDVLPAIQRELSEARGDDRRRLRALLAWVAEQQVDAQLSPLLDQYLSWEATTRIPYEGKEIRFRRTLNVVENDDDRDSRLRLEAARNRRLEEAIPLQIDILHREREAITGLGFGDVIEARERLSGIDFGSLRREALRILATTEDAYRDHLIHQVRKRLKADPAALCRSDVRWLGRMAWQDDFFQLERVFGTVQRDLGELGMPIMANGKVHIDIESRPLKSSGSFCASIQVPDRIMLVVAPTGGWADCGSLLHEVGHAIHHSHTSSSLPFEDATLGDPSVTEAYAVLFELLALERSWLESTTGISGAALEDYRLLAGFLYLFHLRRFATSLLYELELYGSAIPGEWGQRYVELMTGTTGFRHDARTYLEDVERGFTVARRLRGWMLWSILHAQLRDRYDQDWFRNPGAGPFLAELMSAGQREDATQLAEQLGAEQLNADLLLESVATWLR